MNTARFLTPAVHRDHEVVSRQSCPNSASQNRPDGENSVERWLIVIIIVSVFGPYVLPGLRIRTEQLAIYACAAVAWARYPQALFSPCKAIRVPLVLWGLIGITGVLVTLNRTAIADVKWFPLFSGVDHCLSGLAVMVVVGAYFRGSGQTIRKDLVLFGGVLTALLCANTAVELCQLIFGLPFTQYLGMFWTSKGLNLAGSATERAVGANAFDMGRLTGVFNQPVEQGGAYGLAVILWARNYSLRPGRPADYLMLGILLAGGTLGVSKIFLLGFLPLSIMYIVHAQISGRRATSVGDFFGLTVAIALFIGMGFRSEIQSWSGVQGLVNLTKYESGDVLGVITGGRFDVASGGTISMAFRDVWEESPIVGVGFGYNDVIDSAYFQAYMVAGMAGFGAYLLLLIALASPLWSVRGNSSILRPCKLLYTVLILCLAGSGLGAPTLALNRSGTIMWIFILFLNQDLRLLPKMRTYFGTTLSRCHFPHRSDSHPI